MTRRIYRRWTSVMLAAVLLVGVAGCTHDRDTYDPEHDTSVYADAKSTETFNDTFAEAYAQEVLLPDGRKVRVWFSESGSKLREQHYSPVKDAWTKPQTVYASRAPDPCQDVDILQADGYVAVGVGFGMYCYDGEEPDEAVALVSTGDLTTWQVHSIATNHGWNSITIGGDGKVRWTGSGHTLTYTTEAKHHSWE